MTLWAVVQSSLEKYLDDIDAAAQLYGANPLAFKDLDNDDDPDGDIDDILDLDGMGNATLNITGVLTPNGPSPIARFFGVKGTSYKAIVGAVDKATASGAKTLSLNLDSPGGSIQGLDDAWSAVRNFPGQKAAVNRGMMASAAYGLGSAVGPGNLFSSSDFNVVGSIGIMAEVTDDTKRAEASGIKRRTFVSKNAPLKNADPNTAEGEKALQAHLDATERLFHSRIAEGRGVSMDYVAQNYGRGGVLVSADPDSSKPSGKSLGMIDKILPKGVPTLTGQMWSELAAATLMATQKPKPSASAEPRKPEETMDLKTFLAENPDAQAAYTQALASARAEGEKAAQLTAQKVGAILASEVYQKNKVIVAKALETLTGTMAVSTFEAIVNSVDAMSEATAIAAEAAAPHAGKETPAQLEAIAAGIEAEAKALGIDVAFIKAHVPAKDFPAALAAEVENAKLIAHDKGAV